jgi:hypothetical protein
LPGLRPEEVVRLGRGTRLARVYFAGRRAATWDRFRSWGPSALGRFDHHLPPPGESPDRSILSAAGDGETALVEAFQQTAVIHRSRDEPWLVVFSIRRRVRLLDLRGSWSTRAGASMALSTADEPATTQAWARAIHADYEHVHGILYPSTMRGRPAGPVPSGVHPEVFGHNVALFERARPALPPRPRLHLPLSHPGLAAMLGRLAIESGYDVI